MPDNIDEGIGGEAGPAGNRIRECLVILRRGLAAHARHSAKDHHQRAETVFEQSDLILRVACRGHYPLTELEQLSHRLMLDLKPQIRSRDADPGERRFSVKHAMALENV